MLHDAKHSAGHLLTFVHIPKNAGTAIEDAALKQQKLQWGKRADGDSSQTDMEMRMGVGVTQYPDEPVRSCRKERGRFIEGGRDRSGCCTFWHVPPRYLRVNESVGRSLYEKPLRFCVWRDPVERLLSNYLMGHGEYRTRTLPSLCDELQRRHPSGLTAFDVYAKHMVAMVKGYAAADDCHFLSQRHYVGRRHVLVAELRGRSHGEVARALYDPHDARSCNVVLRYDNLSAQFNELMAWAHVHVKLSPLPSNKRLGNETTGTANQMCAYPARSLLSNSTASVVDEYYAADMRLLTSGDET